MHLKETKIIIDVEQKMMLLIKTSLSNSDKSYRFESKILYISNVQYG